MDVGGDFFIFISLYEISTSPARFVKTLNAFIVDLLCLGIVPREDA